MLSQLKSFLSKHWFFLGVVLVILLAYMRPELGINGGPLRPEISVKLVGVSLIFLNSGLSIRTREFAGALSNYKLHLLIQTYTLVLVPLLVNLASPALLRLPLERWVISGLLVVSCLPPPVSSAVILTKAIGGNEAASILNSVLGSFLGIFFSPFLIYISLGLTSSIPFLSIVQTLALTVLLPILVGQLLRLACIGDTLDPYKSFLTNFASSILLAIIYTAFCRTFHMGHADNISLYSLLAIVLIELALQLSLLSLSFFVCTKLLTGFKRDDVISVLFCSTHKSLTLGMPMLSAMFGDSREGVLYAVPLLVYHPMQILLGGILVPYLKNWVSQADASLLPTNNINETINEETGDKTIV